MRALRILTIIATMTGAANAAVAAIYKTDPGHTEVRVAWSHAGVSMQTAEFTKVTGTLDLDPDTLESASLTTVIDAESLWTGVPALDKHGKSADFLEVSTYPEITFESTEVKLTGEDTADITGNLTLHGVTLPIVLQAKLTHLGPHPVGQVFDYYKGDWVAFSATGQIDPAEFGVGRAIPVGPLNIEISAEFKAQK